MYTIKCFGISLLALIGGSGRKGAFPFGWVILKLKQIICLL